MGNPADQPEATETQEEAQPNVTPEEQAAYDQFVNNGMKLVYQNGKVSEAVLGHLQGKWDDLKPLLGEIPQDEGALDPSNPVDNLAVATVGIVLALETSAAGANKPLEPDVVFNGGMELLEQLADVAEAAKIHDYSQDEMDGASSRAALLYGVSSKSVDREEALNEFDHFLKTQGGNLEAALGGGQEQQQPGG